MYVRRSCGDRVSHIQVGPFTFKAIFCRTGLRNEIKTKICSRCFHLPEKERGRDWQVHYVTGVTKSKAHVAAYCNGMDPKESSDDALLIHTLLVHLQNGSLTSVMARKKSEGLAPTHQ